MTPHQKQSRPYWHWERAMNTRHHWSSETETHARRRSVGNTEIQGSRCRPSWTHRQPLVAGIMLLPMPAARAEGLRPFPCLIEARKRIPAGDVELKYISNHLEIGVASIDRIPRGLNSTSKSMTGPPTDTPSYPRTTKILPPGRMPLVALGVSSEKTFTDQGLAGADRAHLGLKEALAA